MAPEDVQLFYQIALTGQQDLPLAPDPRSGIEMVLLRMLAFRPDTSTRSGQEPARREARTGSAPTAGSGASRGRPEPAGHSGSSTPEEPVPSVSPAAALAAARRAIAEPESGRLYSNGSRGRLAESISPESKSGKPPDAVGSASSPSPAELNNAESWHALVRGLRLGGVASQLAANCELSGWDGRRLSLILDPECESMRVASAMERLRAALAAVLGDGLKLDIQIARPQGETPAQRLARRNAERQAEAEAVMEQDPVARFLMDELDARWVPGSIRPAD